MLSSAQQNYFKRKDFTLISAQNDSNIKDLLDKITQILQQQAGEQALEFIMDDYSYGVMIPLLHRHTHIKDIVKNRGKLCATLTISKVNMHKMESDIMKIGHDLGLKIVGQRWIILQN